MREIIITTESGNDLPEHIIKENNIYVAPMYITMNGETFADRSIPVQRIYNYYDETSKIPTTSAVNVYDFENLFKQVREEHPGCVIFHLAYSASTTCSYQNGIIAAENFDDIYFVNTKSVSGGATAFIVKAIEIINKRKESLEDADWAYLSLADELSSLADKIHFSFLPGNLKFLKAGGRCSNAAYIGATLLNIKPLIELKNGELVATKKYRGKTEKLIYRFINDFANENNISKEALYIVATEGLSEEGHDILKNTARELGFKHVEINPCGLVITCHSGPASIGIGGWSKDVENI